MFIGNLKLNNPFIAAPLAGITDSATRLLAREQGASLVYSEMISGKGLLYGSKNTEQLLQIKEAEKPVAYQVFGSDPKVMETAAKKLEERENEVLDINMGCPVPKIVKNGEGSALLKNSELVYNIVRALVDNTKKPVTVKIRAGWDENSINGVEIAKIIEEAGASAVAIHGRTREQYYSGKANWNIIKEIKEAVKIPVIGNGDIFSGEDAIRMLRETGCDFVMIGRGALGNPWIYREAIALFEGKKPHPLPTLKDKKNMMIRHLNLIKENKGEYVALREMRKHVGWYVKGEHGATTIKRNINTINEFQEMIKAIESIV